MEIHLVEDKLTLSKPLWKVMLDGQLIGRITPAATREGWHVLPETGIAAPKRKLTVRVYLSREAAACALACYYYEGEKEVRR